MLRQRLPVRPLTAADRDTALAWCARDRPANVFVAARIEEGALRSNPGALLGHWVDGRLDGLAWASANVVPVGLDESGVADVAARIMRQRRQCASIFGPSEQVVGLWNRLGPSWGPVRAIRGHQPLLATSTRPSRLGLPIDPAVRPATLDEVGLVVPAAAHMFTEEIGYPPYFGSDRSYRNSVAALIRQGHTFVRIEDGEVTSLGDANGNAIWRAMHTPGHARGHLSFYEERRGHANEFYIRVDLLQFLFIDARLDRALRGKKADPFRPVFDGHFQSRNDNTQNTFSGKLARKKTLLQFAQSRHACGIAGHNDQFAAGREQITHGFFGKIVNSLIGAASIRQI